MASLEDLSRGFQRVQHVEATRGRVIEDYTRDACREHKNSPRQGLGHSVPQLRIAHARVASQFVQKQEHVLGLRY